MAAVCSRAILHVDVDCFYVQVELVRNPKLDPERPVAVTQKFLVVTANYAARVSAVIALSFPSACHTC